MQIEKVNSTININEDIEFQKKGWFVQKIAIVLIFVVVVLSILGIFGHGILSTKKEKKDGIELSYEKFLRSEAGDKLEFYFDNPDSIATLSFPIEYTKHVRIENTEPKAISSEIVNGQAVYKFQVEKEGRIMLFINPCDIGSVSSTMKLNSTQFSIHHFIYP